MKRAARSRSSTYSAGSSGITGAILTVLGAPGRRLPAGARGEPRASPRGSLPRARVGWGRRPAAPVAEHDRLSFRRAARQHVPGLLDLDVAEIEAGVVRRRAGRDDDRVRLERLHRLDARVGLEPDVHLGEEPLVVPEERA